MFITGWGEGGGFLYWGRWKLQPVLTDVKACDFLTTGDQKAKSLFKKDSLVTEEYITLYTHGAMWGAQEGALAPWTKCFPLGALLQGPGWDSVGGALPSHLILSPKNPAWG